MNRQTLYEIVSSRINKNEDLSCAETILYAADRGHESDRVKELNREFFQRMEGILGHVDCAPIKKRWRTESDGCLPVMMEAARVLQEIVDRELGKEP